MYTDTHTHTDTYIREEGFNPRPHKHAVLNSLTFRIINTPLKETEYKKEYENIVKIAEKNGFNKYLVDKKIKKTKKRRKQLKTLQN